MNRRALPILAVLAAASSTLAATPPLDSTAFSLTTSNLAALSSATHTEPAKDPTNNPTAQDAAAPSETTADSVRDDQLVAPRIAFGKAGSDWLTFGAAYAYDLTSEHDFNLHFAWSRFLGDDIEFGIEAAPWYFAQDGDDTVGLSGSMFFRWHLLQDHDHLHLDPDWTVFAEVGIGMLFALDEVPDGGTTVDFLPRVGGGATFRLDDHGNRLVTGLRWHHVSNGRFEGNEQNPARDSILFFIGVQVPF